jgi:hypothetical protein
MELLSISELSKVIRATDKLCYSGISQLALCGDILNISVLLKPSEKMCYIRISAISQLQPPPKTRSRLTKAAPAMALPFINTNVEIMSDKLASPLQKSMIARSQSTSRARKQVVAE